MKIYLAPLQGGTDYVFRNAYFNNFNLIDKYFTPYLTLEGNGRIRNLRKKEVLAENNINTKAIPQILTSTIEETRTLCKILKDADYKEINLNMGCPHTMATKRGKGAGLLPHPEKIKDVLGCIHNEFGFKVSVKSRTGLLEHNEFDKVLEILNTFPLTEIILHPRTGKQMYKGSADIDQFKKYSTKTNIPFIYNGDVTNENFEEMIDKLDNPENIMIGRGITNDIFLPAKIKNLEYDFSQWKKFHEDILNGYIEDQDNEGNAHTKMKHFWLHFGEMFPENKKERKAIKKSGSISVIREVVNKM